jgi:hypothetical protein
MTLQQVLAFSWQLAIGNTTLTIDEFEQLVALKHPLVQVRGEWVAIDPDPDGCSASISLATGAIAREGKHTQK